MKTYLIGFCLLLSGALHSQQLLLKLINPKIEGSHITYDVVSDSLTALLTMQYGIRYDSTRLRYATTKNHALPNMTQANFNAPWPGALLTVWFEASLTPVTLDHGTVLYQVEFELLGSDPGDVCFSDEVLAYEFMDSQSVLLSFYIIDDCYPDPFPIPLTTSTAEAGVITSPVQVASPVRQQQVSFTLDTDRRLAIQLVDLQGNVVSNHPSRQYHGGVNAVTVSGDIVPGLYVFATEIDGQPVRKKIIIQ